MVRLTRDEFVLEGSIEMMRRFLGPVICVASRDEDVTEIYINPQDHESRIDQRGRERTSFPCTLEGTPLNSAVAPRSGRYERHSPERSSHLKGPRPVDLAAAFAEWYKLKPSTKNVTRSRAVISVGIDVKNPPDRDPGGAAATRAAGMMGINLARVREQVKHFVTPMCDSTSPRALRLFPTRDRERTHLCSRPQRGKDTLCAGG